MTIVLLTIAVVIGGVAFIANWMGNDLERRQLRRSAQDEADHLAAGFFYRHSKWK